jgi:phenylalanyl-tRNA synthetase beta subunit
LTLHNDEATLTDPQIEAAMAAVLAQVVQDLGARQR